MLAASREKAEDDARQDRGKIYDLAAAVRAMIWKKNVPSYDELFPGDRKKEMTDEEMFAQVRALNAMFGGTEV